MEEFSSNYSLSNTGARPVAIISQMLQYVAGVHHIDELLGWIANAMVRHLEMASVQVWAAQAYTTGALRRKLRASASQHPFQATQVVESAEVGVIIDRMLREQQGMLSIPVPNILSQYRAELFLQQNCRYWTVYFLRNDVLLPPVQENAYVEEVATPLQMAFSFFSQDPLQASQTRTISFLIEQALRVAMSKGLLSFTPTPPRRSEVATEPLFAAFVPERIQIVEVEQAENPFNSAVIMTDKKARQMYNLIDGRKNIAELIASTRVSQREALGILQDLVLQRRIVLREPGGNPVDISPFLQLS